MNTYPPAGTAGFAFHKGWLIWDAGDWILRARVQPEPQLEVEFRHAWHDTMNSANLPHVLGSRMMSAVGRVVRQLEDLSPLDVPEPEDSTQMLLSGFQRVSTYSLWSEPDDIALWNDRHAIRAFWDTIPEEVRREHGRYGYHEWPILDLLIRFPGAMDLSRSNGALFFLLSSHFARTLGFHHWPYDEIKSLLQKKQVQIMAHIGQPASESNRRILAKVSVDSYYEVGGRILDLLEQNPAIHKNVQHLPVINSGLQQLLGAPDYYPNLTGPFLHEVAGMDDYRSGEYFYLEFLDSMDLLHRAGLKEKKIYSTQGLRRLHDELMTRLGPEGLMSDAEKALQFPPPPHLGTENIIPLDSPAALFREGVEMRHCAAIYGKSVAAGEVYLYRVLQPVRATLEIAKDHDGRWALRQIAQKCNKHVPTTVADQILTRLFESPATQGARSREPVSMLDADKRKCVKAHPQHCDRIDKRTGTANDKQLPLSDLETMALFQKVMRIASNNRD